MNKARGSDVADAISNFCAKAAFAEHSKAALSIHKAGPRTLRRARAPATHTRHAAGDA
jgi:hypothetical protein